MKNIKGYIEHLRESNGAAGGPTDELLRLLLETNSLKNEKVIEEAKRLIAEGADLEAKEPSHGRNALHLAIWRGSNEIALAIIEAGADLEAKDNAGYTPLVAAAQFGRQTIVKALVASGADVHARNPMTNGTVLHLGAGLGSDIIKLFLKNGISVDSRDNMGTTALYWAAGSGKVKEARELLKAGADPNAMDNDGVSVLKKTVSDFYPGGSKNLPWAKRFRDQAAVARLLILAGADMSTAFKDPDVLEEFFGGDISWIPEDQPGFDRLRKHRRARGAFGRF
jgi:ankyrin repeat protein